MSGVRSNKIRSPDLLLLLLPNGLQALLSVSTHARKLEVGAPIISMHRPCTRRSVLQTPVTQIDSTTPGHSPSIGHGSPPN